MPSREIAWRIAAARAAEARFDRSTEADHCLRAIDLWPDDDAVVGDPATPAGRLPQGDGRYAVRPSASTRQPP